MPQPIYLDYNASTPIAREVLEAMTATFRDVHGNALSTHAFGVAARRVVETARAEVAASIGAEPDEVVFTSGGTESNNAAIVRRRRGARRIAGGISSSRRSSTPRSSRRAALLEKRGWGVTRVQVDPARRRSTRARIESAIRPDTVLVSVMHANNETGVIQPVAAAARAAHARGVLIHTDAAQSLGKIRVNVASWTSICSRSPGTRCTRRRGSERSTCGAARRLPSPARRGPPAEPPVRHRERRALGSARRRVRAWRRRELGARREHAQAMRDRLERKLREAFPALVVHGARSQASAEHALRRVSRVVDANEPPRPDGRRRDGLRRGLPLGKADPSKVLLAMGVKPEIARATLRLTTGRPTTQPRDRRRRGADRRSGEGRLAGARAREPRRRPRRRRVVPGPLPVRPPPRRAREIAPRRRCAGQRQGLVGSDEDDVVLLVDLLQPEGFTFDDEAQGALRRPRRRDRPLRTRRSGPETAASHWTVGRLNREVKAALDGGVPAGDLARRRDQRLQPQPAQEARRLHADRARRRPASRRTRCRRSSSTASRQEIERKLAAAGNPFRLEDEVEVRVRVRVDLYDAWGAYRVQIEDLDLAFTLGEAARRREEIVRSARRGGAPRTERGAPASRAAVARSGLITSLNSDAYHDVLRTLGEKRLRVRR